MCDVALVHQSELFFSFGIEKAAAMTNASYYERGEERACECLSMFVCLSICACAIHACVLDDVARGSVLIAARALSPTRRQNHGGRNLCCAAWSNVGKRRRWEGGGRGKRVS